MKRRDNELRAFLAVLPVLTFSGEAVDFLLPVAVVCGAALLFFLFFQSTRSLFPPRLFPAAVLLSAAAGFEVLYLLKEIPLLWAASFFLLLEEEDLKRSRHLFHRLTGLLLRLALFAGLTGLLALLRQGGQQHPVLLFWSRPEGFLLILALVSLFAGLDRPLPRKPGKKRAARSAMPEEAPV